MPHTCFLCSSENPDRVVTHTADGSIASYPRRFEGPEGMVNGGIAIAAMGCAALHNAPAGDDAIYRLTGRLRRPVPLARDLQLSATRDEGAWATALLNGEDSVVTGSVVVGPSAAATWAPVPGHLAEPLARLQALAGSRPAAGTRTVGEGLVQAWGPMVQTCFGCLRPRERGGLNLPGYIMDTGTVWSELAPDPTLTDPAVTLPAAIAAAAADCQTGIVQSADPEFDRALGTDSMATTGSLDYHFLRPLPSWPEPLRVLGAVLGRDGRKVFGMAAIFDAGNTPCVVSEATWIIIPRPAPAGQPTT